jgi:proline iminopeptidase
VAHPPIEPFDHGSIEVAGGNTIYWETSGNPAGKPVLFLQAVREVASGRGYRRQMDPAKHLIVGIDQRGCGRSRPLITWLSG